MPNQTQLRTLTLKSHLKDQSWACVSNFQPMYKQLEVRKVRRKMSKKYGALAWAHCPALLLSNHYAW